MILYEMVNRDYKVAENALGIHVDAETRTIVAIEVRRNKGGDVVSLDHRFMKFPRGGSVERLDSAYFSSGYADSTHYSAIGYDAWSIELKRSLFAQNTTDNIVDIKQGQGSLTSVFVEIERDLAVISRLTEYVKMEMLSELYRPTRDEQMFLLALANAYGASQYIRKDKRSEEDIVKIAREIQRQFNKDARGKG